MKNNEKIGDEYYIGVVLNDVYNEISKIANEKKLPFFMEADKDIPAVLIGDENLLKGMLIKNLTAAVENMSRGFVKCALKGEILQDKDGINLHFKVYCQGNKDELKEKEVKKSGFLNFLKRGSKECEANNCNNWQFDLEQRIADYLPMGDFRYSRKNIDCKPKEDVDRDINVLIIDDNKINITIIKSFLKRFKMSIDEGSSGRECIEMLKEKKYDIVFLDHMMPEMDGIETIRQHREDIYSINKNTPIIALTANSSVGAREEYMREGFADYLAKPIEAEKLDRIIEQNCF
jgi:CheY-like chemotaxis protein